MSVRLSELFEHCGLEHLGPVRWGTPLDEDRPGVYLIVRQTPEGRPEEVLYIGKSRRALQTRLQEFYTHRYGASAPHSGGQAILLLPDLPQLTVHWGVCSEPENAKSAMLQYFRRRRGVLPFANRRL